MRPTRPAWPTASLPRRWRRAATGLACATVLAFLFFGIADISSGWRVRDATRPIAGGATTRGTAVGVRTTYDRSGPLFVTTVSFADSDGRRHEFVAPASVGKTRVGAPVTVSYDPRDPARAHDLSDRGTDWRGPLASGIVFSAFVVIVIIALGWSTPRRRKMQLAAGA